MKYSVSLLADLFLYSYEVEFIQKLHKEGQKARARMLHLTFRDIDDALPLNNDNTDKCLHLIKAHKINMSYLIFDYSFQTSIVITGKLTAKLYNKIKKLNNNKLSYR